jgi:hypothetical protein
MNHNMFFKKLHLKFNKFDTIVTSMKYMMMKWNRQEVHMCDKWVFSGKFVHVKNILRE